MRQSFGAAFKIVIGLEGKSTNDPNDPGGLTVYGLSKRYNPTVHLDMTLQEAKDIYLYKYWMATGCDDAPFPMDLVLFDTSVNQGSGTLKTLIGGDLKEFLKQNTYQDLLLKRMIRYQEHSKDVFVKGHLNRVLKLYREIKELSNGNQMST